LGDFRRIILLTLAITPSGALSPGPLSASAVAVGALLGVTGGLVIALGHMIIELPYIILIYKFTAGLRSILGKTRLAMNTVITLFLLYFSYMLLQDSIRVLNGGNLGSSSGVIASSYLGAFIIGIALTGFNVYFLVWWLTVGYPLIEEASRLGVRGLTVMYTSHVWMDYVWLAILSAGGGASRLLGSTGYAVLLVILALILIVFALKIAVDTIRQLIAKTSLLK